MSWGGHVWSCCAPSWRPTPVVAATHRSCCSGSQASEPLHLGLARDAYRDGFGAALTAGRLAIRGGCGVAAAARALPSPPHPHAPDLLLDGLALLATEGYAAACRYWAGR